ncbi:hypothetical protein O9992_11125 [Vibrio lentus]|nr:hypothetical protein [Vibrio lentus]
MSIGDINITYMQLHRNESLSARIINNQCLSRGDACSRSNWHTTQQQSKYGVVILLALIVSAAGVIQRFLHIAVK